MPARITQQVFLEVYNAIKQEISKKPFVGRLTEDGKHSAIVDKVIDIINKFNADLFHFLGFACRYYAPARIFPTINHLISPKFIERYRYFQHMKNVYNYNSYAINGDDVVIYATQEIVSLSRDINNKFDQDIRFRFISHLIETGDLTNIKQEDLPRIWKSAHYARVKLEHRKHVVPDNIIQLISTLDKMIGANYAKQC